MPTYDYECLECGHRFEHMQKMSDNPLQECLKCSGQVRRLLSGGSGLIFKGSGFYITDYAKKNSGSNNKNTTTGENTSSDKAKKKDTK